jgi:hypothetical protein
MSVFLPLTFPSGRPPSPRWWWVGVVGAAALIFGFVFVTIDALTKPLDRVLASTFASMTLFGLMFTGAVGAMASVVVRYRRAGEVERRQVKWVTASLVAVCATIAVSVTPVARSIGTLAISQFAVIGVMCTIPVTIGIAITRYRLYAIDRIISRAASWFALTLLLSGVYVAAVLGLQLLLLPLIGESQLAVAGATLGVAVLFGPARTRLQSAMDRRFNRSRYDAERTVALLQLRLRDQVDLDQIETELKAAVRTTMEPAAVFLWVRPPGPYGPEDSVRTRQFPSFPQAS